LKVEKSIHMQVYVGEGSHHRKIHWKNRPLELPVVAKWGYVGGYLAQKHRKINKKRQKTTKKQLFLQYIGKIDIRKTHKNPLDRRKIDMCDPRAPPYEAQKNRFTPTPA